MPEGQDVRITAITRPAQDDAETWRSYWRERDMPWRRAPEIGQERQRELAARISRQAGRKTGFPFGGERLSRGDVEWLLAEHDDGRGPLDWSQPEDRGRPGLDLRGADLRGVDLSGLPLARLCGGLHEDAWRNATREELREARIHLEEANLTGAHLEGALLDGAHLEFARLGAAHLEHAHLDFALLDGAYLTGASLNAASLTGASLLGAILNDAHLEDTTLLRARLAGAELGGTHFEGARLREALLAGMRIDGADLERLRAIRADAPVRYRGAWACGAFFNEATVLDDAVLADEREGALSVADVRWGGVNLAVVSWDPVHILGDEVEARDSLSTHGNPKDAATRLAEYRSAVRANRQLAVSLRDQGLNEEADRYFYRAQKLQRQVTLLQAVGAAAHGSWWRRAIRLGSYFFSLFLDALAGYGYRPGRSLVAYICTLTLFAILYHVLSAATGTPLSAVASVALSINSFHGRGFFSGAASGDPVTIAAAVEAIAGLIIEISFIATFTQRFFAR